VSLVFLRSIKIKSVMPQKVNKPKTKEIKSINLTYFQFKKKLTFQTLM